MGDKNINFTELNDLNEIMNNKIKIVKRKNYDRFLDFRGKILDISCDTIKRFGINAEIEKISHSELCYHGCFFKQLIAFDKITNDRIEAVKNKKYKVSYINKKDDSVEIEIIQNMLDDCIDYDVKNIEKFLDYVLFMIGDKTVKSIDLFDEDNKYYFYNFKPIPLLFFPSGYFMNLTTWNYFGMDFEKFFNLTQNNVFELLYNSNFNDANIIYKKILLVESYFYAPYFVNLIKAYM